MDEDNSKEWKTWQIYAFKTHRSLWHGELHDTRQQKLFFLNKYAFLYTAELRVTLHENAAKVETVYLYVLVHLITMATEWDV